MIWWVPCKIYPDFFRVASTQIFFRVAAWKKLGVVLIDQKKCEHPEKTLAWFYRVDFTGYPSNHFSGCRLNRRMYLWFFWSSVLASNEAGCLLIRHNECRQQYFLIFNFLLVSLLKARWIKTCENKKIGNNERSICIAPYITSYLMWSWMLYKPGKWLRSKKLSNFHSYFAWNSIETSALSRVKSKTKS